MCVCVVVTMFPDYDSGTTYGLVELAAMHDYGFNEVDAAHSIV
jgi:hypothetical protein